MLGSLAAGPALVHAQSADESAPPADLQEQATGPGPPEWVGEFAPPDPIPGGWDWIRTASQEWIKGEIVLMRDFDLEFDSDEFGIVKLDWADVVEIRSERLYTLVLQDMQTSHTGTFAIRGDRVTVNVGDGIETFDRTQLLAITPSGHVEINLWTARASVGFSFRSGNTDQTEITGDMRLGREGKNTRAGIQYTGAYGSLDDEKNTNNHRGQGRFDYFLTRDFFLTPAAFEVFSDEFQNVSYRLTPTTGAGYYLIRRPAVEWQAGLGVGYQHVRIDSAVPGDSKTADNGAIVFRTLLDADLNSRTDLTLEYQLQLITPDTDLSNHHAVATLEIELTSVIDLDLKFIWDRIEGPEKDSGGKEPDSNDYRITAGLAIEY